MTVDDGRHLSETSKRGISLGFLHAYAIYFTCEVICVKSTILRSSQFLICSTICIFTSHRRTTVSHSCYALYLSVLLVASFR